MTPCDPLATFSPDRLYRYTLWREVSPIGEDYMMFIGLNPSTADETRNDPTVRRCMQFARDHGMRWLLMTNLFAFRATDPRVMKGCGRPIGDENDRYLVQGARNARHTVAAWGTHGEHMGRDQEVLKLVSELSCLGKTKHGHPKHPLYVRADTQLIDYP